MSNLNIIDAATQGNFERVRHLIEVEKVDVNSKDTRQGCVIK